jgi:protein-S-isoprenylcysteine O-methyltransferase Ste14
MAVPSSNRTPSEPLPGPGSEGARHALNLGIAVLYLYLVAVHVAVARQTGNWAVGFPLVLQEGLLVVLFLTRRRSVLTSTQPLDWVLGVGGTGLPLLLRPASGPPAGFGVAQLVQILALLAAIGATASLGRSVGVVAANRGVASRGAYGFVRHPMYAAYAVAYLGYTAGSPSLRNVILMSATIAAFVMRAAVEERLLLADVAYRAYARRVRWRFVPYVY